MPLLLNLQRVGALDNTEFWRNQSEWILDIEQTHTAFPILTYFPETHGDHSWVATIGTLLDAAALVLSSSETQAGASFEDIEKGPMMVLVYGMPGFVRVARAASIPIGEPMGIAEVVGRFSEPAPPITITRAEYDEAMAALAPLIGVAPDRTEEGVAPLRVDPLELRAGGAVVGRAHVRVPRPVDDRPCREGRPAAVPSAPGHRGGLVGERDGTR